VEEAGLQPAGEDPGLGVTGLPAGAFLQVTHAARESRTRRPPPKAETS
jgi:hypothetical protein